MVIVVQRVLQASVTVEGRNVGEIGHGLLLLVGIANGDSVNQSESLANRIRKLRVFEDTEGKMGLDVIDAKGAILAVSQFTLLADFSKGNRPSFHHAAKPAEARPVFDALVEALQRETSMVIETGEFGADMKVALVNDGPVTFVLEG
ncbi:MAG TPA: D-tyrosyl-tRNA(Tyr) deacylase [Opitutae bacterium]|nr:D-tyrosyl-tRNA(Tyr) deacylase [Opitutae bacterium]